MKNSFILISAIVVIILTASCEKKDNDFDSKIKNGFSLVINDSITYNSNHIDFYDFSSQLIYLKTGNIFSFSNQGTFKVLVDDEEIYNGQMFPMYSSYMPIGAFIRCPPTFYKDFIIPIDFSQYTDSDSISNEDPRNDLRIIEALKKHNQYKQGLSFEILSIQKLSTNIVKITMELTNHDSEKLLFLDPDKMGLALFHYFTNGLILKESSNNSITHNLTVQQPEPWDTWQNNWFSEINSDETKIITITYNDFKSIHSGQYTASFVYPGLSYQVDKEDLQQDNGRIWLGQLIYNKIINIE